MAFSCCKTEDVRCSVVRMIHKSLLWTTVQLNNWPSTILAVTVHSRCNMELAQTQTEGGSGRQK